MSSQITHPNDRPWQPGAVISLDVGGTKIAGAAVCYGNDAQEAPRIACRTAIPTNAQRGGAAVLEAILDLAGDLVAASPLPVLGIGVGTAGRVDARTGSIAYANEIMPGWTGQPVRAALAERAGLPVSVLNDVQAHAFGEARWGAGRGAETCIVVTVGTGLGAGVIAHGRIVRGAHGFAGEFGSTMNPLAADCLGGSPTGTLESIAAGSGIEACYRAAGGEALNGAEISRRANEGDLLARRIVEQAGYGLGIALASWTNMLDPDKVILSGSVVKAGALWRNALQRGFLERIPPVQADLPVVPASLGDDAPLVGAAEFFLSSL